MATVSKEHIAITPGTCGGRPRIAGTRIRVQDVAFYHYGQSWSPETIVHEFPHITLADVLAALAYYHDHREQIDRQVEEGEAFARDFFRGQKSLQEKLGLDS